MVRIVITVLLNLIFFVYLLIVLKSRSNRAFYIGLGASAVVVLMAALAITDALGDDGAYYFIITILAVVAACLLVSAWQFIRLMILYYKSDEELPNKKN